MADDSSVVSPVQVELDPRGPRRRTPVSKSKPRILIVEDERIVALHLRRRLTALGYQVSAAVSSGARALREIRETRPDLVLMDINIDGELDGIETTKSMPPEFRVPVIYLTAHSEEPVLERARGSLAYGYLLKPFSDRELHATIQMVLERRKADAALLESQEQLRETTVELVEQKKRLTIALEKARKASRAKSDFLATMSHELRTPMNAILGFGQLLSLKAFGKLNPRQQEYVGNILYAGEHLLRLIEDLLDLSKIEAAQLRLAITRVEVSPVLERVASSLAPLAETHDVELAIEVSRAPIAAADKTRLDQVLINLISNAIKYNRRGGSVRVSDEACAEGWVRIAVTDTGIGIPEHRQRQMFEPFNRLGAEGGRVEGTGIGLPLSKRLVELMGGRLGFESTLDVGSKFWVDLPAHHDAGVSSDLRDTLTGLPNRLILADRISGAIALAPRHMKKVAVLSLDLDGLGEIRESLGLRAGDKLLQSIAQRLVSCVRGSDTVSRENGDKFVVLLSAVDRSEDVAMAVKRMTETLAEPHSVDDRDLKVSASIGISLCPDDGLDAETLLKRADIALHRAKENGRESCRFS